jgi:hypothetical protein
MFVENFEQEELNHLRTYGMVELRWRNVYSQVLFKGTKHVNKTVLEYRQKINNEWTSWVEVPTVDDN